MRYLFIAYMLITMLHKTNAAWDESSVFTDAAKKEVMNSGCARSVCDIDVGGSGVLVSLTRHIFVLTAAHVGVEEKIKFVSFCTPDTVESVFGKV